MSGCRTNEFAGHRPATATQPAKAGYIVSPRRQISQSFHALETAWKPI